MFGTDYLLQDIVLAAQPSYGGEVSFSLREHGSRFCNTCHVGMQSCVLAWASRLRANLFQLSLALW